MFDKIIKSITLVEGSNIFTSQTDEGLNHEECARLFDSKNVKELMVSTESSYIYAKRYNRNIIILTLDRAGPLSISLSKARVAARQINTLYTSGSLELTKFLKYKIEPSARAPREKSSVAKSGLIDSLAMGIFQDNTRKEKEMGMGEEKKEKEKVEEAKKAAPGIEEPPAASQAEDKEELQELAEEIMRFRQAWKEKKKKTEE